MIQRLIGALGMSMCLSIFALPALAGVLVVIDKSSQRMTVSVDGTPRYVWPVSTGRNHHWTPSGRFGVQSLDAHHYSSRYNNAPMPHAIFFDGNRAIHGTTYLSQLGRPASHGCVRLAPQNAATLYRLVVEEGTGSTRIIVR